MHQRIRATKYVILIVSVLFPFSKANIIFADNENWKIINDVDRRDIFEDVINQLAKRERVRHHCVIITHAS